MATQHETAASHEAPAIQSARGGLGAIAPKLAAGLGAVIVVAAGAAIWIGVLPGPGPIYEACLDAFEASSDDRRILEYEGLSEASVCSCAEERYPLHLQSMPSAEMQRAIRYPVEHHEKISFNESVVSCMFELSAELIHPARGVHEKRPRRPRGLRGRSALEKTDRKDVESRLGSPLPEGCFSRPAREGLDLGRDMTAGSQGSSPSTRIDAMRMLPQGRARSNLPMRDDEGSTA